MLNKVKAHIDRARIQIDFFVARPEIHYELKKISATAARVNQDLTKALRVHCQTVLVSRATTEAEAKELEEYLEFKGFSKLLVQIQRNVAAQKEYQRRYH